MGEKCSTYKVIVDHVMSSLLGKCSGGPDAQRRVLYDDVLKQLACLLQVPGRCPSGLSYLYG